MENPDNEKLFSEAIDKYDEGDYKAAFDLFTQLAEQGEAWAMDYLGMMYGEGEGVEKDNDKSLLYHKLAAHKSKNLGFEYNNVARQYEIMENRRRALYWWNKAVAHGDKSAGLRLAKLLLINNRSDSRKRAIELLQIAADAEKQIEISEDEKEEAQELLTELSGQYPIETSA